MDVMRDYSALSFGSTSQSLTRLVSVSSHFTCNLLTTITCTYGLTGIVKLPVDVDLLPAWRTITVCSCSADGNSPHYHNFRTPPQFTYTAGFSAIKFPLRWIVANFIPAAAVFPMVSRGIPTENFPCRSLMDSTKGGGHRMKEPVDLKATSRHYHTSNMFVTPGRVCDRCSSTEVSVVVVTFTCWISSELYWTKCLFKSAI